MAEGDFPKDSGTNKTLYLSELNQRLYNPTITVAADGLGDYSSIQDAIDALGSGGGKIFVRKGTYTITSAITFAASNILIEGEGPASRINFNAATVATAIKMSDTTQRSFIHLRNLRISQQGTAGTGVAIDASYFALCKFTDLYIDGVNGGMLFNATGTLYNTIENVRISCSGSGSYGMKFDNAANENTVLRTRIVTSADSTGVIVNAHGNSLYDFDVETGAAVGIDIQASGHDCTIVAPYLEGNIINFQAAADVEATTVIGGVMIDASTNNINNLGAKGLTFINTRVQYEQFNYRESLNAFPRVRWVKPYHDAVVATSQAFTAGRVLLSEFELQDDAFIEGVTYIVGGTSNGNVRVGIYGPITTEETALDAPLLVESASTAQGSINTSQSISLTKTKAKAGRYYVALQGDSGTGTYQRNTNQTQVTGWGQYYDRGGGYGAFTTPCPAVTNTGSALPGIKVQCGTLTTL